MKLDHGKLVQRMRCPAPHSFRLCTSIIAGVGALLLLANPVAAHGPLFSAGPETIWKDGKEVSLGYHTQRKSGYGQSAKQQEVFSQVLYGITSNWQIEAELPYRWNEAGALDSVGVGDVSLGTKYQFFVKNFPGGQNKAAVFLKTKLPTGDAGKNPPTGSGSTDLLVGLSVGHESRRWYGFADARYKINGEGSGNFRNGNKLFLDVVGGVRPVLSEYEEPDTVLMLELNYEQTEPAQIGSFELANTGGWEMFISPVIWWTYGQFAIKAGVQIPIASSLNGSQLSSDYRGLIETVYHF